MKILGISSSPRTNGNTGYLLNQLLEGAVEVGAEVERVNINKMHILGCQGDMVCKRTGRCGIKDDMQGIFNKIDEADVVVFSSPVYMASVNSQLKAVLDRLFQYMKSDYSSTMKPSKRAVLLATQAHPDETMFSKYLDVVPFGLGAVGFTTESRII